MARCWCKYESSSQFLVFLFRFVYTLSATALVAKRESKSKNYKGPKTGRKKLTVISDPPIPQQSSRMTRNVVMKASFSERQPPPPRSGALGMGGPPVAPAGVHGAPRDGRWQCLLALLDRHPCVVGPHSFSLHVWETNALDLFVVPTLCDHLR